MQLGNSFRWSICCFELTICNATLSFRVLTFCYIFISPLTTLLDVNPMLLLPGANDRYLDNRLFAHEVRMNKLLRNKDHAEQIVSDVRTAVNSLIHLMTINHKLMYALPRSEPPQIKSNDDIAGGRILFVWFVYYIFFLSCVGCSSPRFSLVSSSKMHKSCISLIPAHLLSHRLLCRHYVV